MSRDKYGYYLDDFYNINNLKLFYSSLNSIDFNTLTPERIFEIQQAVSKNMYRFKEKCVSHIGLMCYVAERMRVSAKNFGMFTDTERALFYIMAVDPTFKFLEVYEAANKKEEIKQYSKATFHIYDPYIIKLERYANKVLGLYKDIWSRETIQR